MKNNILQTNQNDLETLICLAKEVAKPSEDCVRFCKWIIATLLVMLGTSIGVNVYMAINGVEVTMVADSNTESMISQTNE